MRGIQNLHNTNISLALSCEKEPKSIRTITISNALMCINACGISKSRDSADMVSELNNRIIEKVAENYEEGNISALDIL